jgi:hypothetical protein
MTKAKKMIAKKKSTKRSVKATKAAPAKTIVTKAAGGPSKSDFIRSLDGVSPAEVVEKGKAAGLEFTAAYVSTVRYNAKKSGLKKVGSTLTFARRGRPVGAPRLQTSTKRTVGIPRELVDIVWKNSPSVVADWVSDLATMSPADLGAYYR